MPAKHGRNTKFMHMQWSAHQIRMIIQLKHRDPNAKHGHMCVIKPTRSKKRKVAMRELQGTSKCYNTYWIKMKPKKNPAVGIC